jgi:excisionase family DNA binding protein
MKNKIKRLLTVAEAAAYLGISPRTIYNQTSRKAKRKFPVQPLRLGKCLRFDINDLREFVESQKAQN